MGYIEAYKARMERNHETFTTMSAKLVNHGCTVWATKSGLINFIKVFKDGKHIVFGFGQVPYRWYLEACIKPSKERGSGYTIEDTHGTENPYTVEHILSKMVNNPDVKGFKEPSYLSKVATHVLKQNGETVFEGLENQCYYKLQNVQSQSADWAMRHEGWTITNKLLS